MRELDLDTKFPIMSVSAQSNKEKLKQSVLNVKFYCEAGNEIAGYHTVNYDSLTEKHELNKDE